MRLPCRRGQTTGQGRILQPPPRALRPRAASPPSPPHTCGGEGRGEEAPMVVVSRCARSNRVCASFCAWGQASNRVCKACPGRAAFFQFAGLEGSPAPEGRPLCRMATESRSTLRQERHIPGAGGAAAPPKNTCLAGEDFCPAPLPCLSLQGVPPRIVTNIRKYPLTTSA